MYVCVCVDKHLVHKQSCIQPPTHYPPLHIHTCTPPPSRPPHHTLVVSCWILLYSSYPHIILRGCVPQGKRHTCSPALRQYTVGCGRAPQGTGPHCFSSARPPKKPSSHSRPRSSCTCSGAQHCNEMTAIMSFLFSTAFKKAILPQSPSVKLYLQWCPTLQRDNCNHVISLQHDL